MTNQISQASPSFDLPTLTQVVSDVTRFPVELLQPDIDFEDELGIDSLKQAEIAAVLADRLNVPRERLSIINDAATIRDLLNKLNGLSLDTNAVSAPAPRTVDDAVVPMKSPAPPVAEESAHVPATETLAQIRALLGDAKPTLEFAGKVAFVTGSGHGLGRVTACELARRGATVIVNSFHNRTAGEETVTMIQDAGGKAVHQWGSVAQPAQLDDIFAAIEQQFGGLDFFIHNASDGIFAKLDQAREKDWMRSFRTNVLGFHHGAMRAAELMRRRGGGKIVTLSAVYEGLTVDYFGVQGPVKAALESLTRFVAKEVLDDNIQVNCIALGALEGDIMNAYPEADRIIAMTESRSQGRRRCTELEAAKAQAFLLSSAADSITGSVLRMDRGMCIA